MNVSPFRERLPDALVIEQPVRLDCAEELALSVAQLAEGDCAPVGHSELESAERLLLALQALVVMSPDEDPTADASVEDVSQEFLCELGEQTLDPCEGRESTDAFHREAAEIGRLAAVPSSNALQ